MSIEMTGLADIVRQHAAERPDTAALVHAGRTTSYAELDRAASRVANGLIAEGIKPQARVAHLDKSSDVFFELLFGTAKANAVMVSVNWRLAPPEVLHILNDAQAEILFVGEEFFPVIEKIRDGLKTVARIVAFGGRHGAWTSFTEWRDRQSAADPHLSIRSGDTAVQFYTSGTTGLPKGAELSNANFAWMFPLWTRTWLLAPGVPNLVCLPMFHIGGAGWGIAGLFAGATNHVVREFIPAEILQLIERERLQVMLLVPAMILFLVQAPQIRETDLSSLRLIVYGAAPIPARALEAGLGDLPVRLPAGLRPHRDDGRHHAAAARRPRPGRRRKAVVVRLRASRRRTAHCRRDEARICRQARSARSPCARRRSCGATGGCPTPPGARSRTTGS